MSVVKLLQDYQHENQDGTKRAPGKRGELYNVPFVTAKQLIADGIAMNPLAGKQQPATSEKDQQIAALKKRVAELEQAQAQPAATEKVKK